MIAALTHVAVGVVAILVGLGGGYAAARHFRARQEPPGSRRILLPLGGTQLSRRAFDAAVRLARAEDATLMPAMLATVPLHLPLDAPLPLQCATGMPLLEAVEQRAAALGVPVDARIERGRSPRHALRRLLEAERVDRVIVSAEGSGGLSADDLEWLLDAVPAEVMILRAAPDDDRIIGRASALA